MLVHDNKSLWSFYKINFNCDSWNYRHGLHNILGCNSIFYCYALVFGQRPTIAKRPTIATTNATIKGIGFVDKLLWMYLQNNDFKLTCAAYVFTSSNSNGFLSIKFVSLSLIIYCFSTLAAYISCIFIQLVLKFWECNTFASKGEYEKGGP